MTQTQPDQDNSLDEALDLLLKQIQALQTRQAKTEQTLKSWITWTKTQFQQIMSALNKLDAPPSTDEAPALQEIRDQIAELDRDLTTVWRSVFPKDSQAPS